MTLDFNLEKAKKDLEEFLKDNPDMLRFQNELQEQFAFFGNIPEVNIQIIRHQVRDKLNRIMDLNNG